MNKNLQNKIKTYAGVVSAILAADKASGQIVYVDVNPDTLVSANLCDSYKILSIDIDNDSIMDFDLKANWNAHCYGAQFVNSIIEISPLLGNKINNNFYNVYTGSGTLMKLEPMKLNTGDTISINGSWLSLTKFLYKEGQNSSSFPTVFWEEGVWNPNSDNYLPFLLFKNPNHYFGWMHIEIVDEHSFILKDYAYNSIPNAPIIAGDTLYASLSLNELNSGFLLSQQNNSIHISSHQQMNHAIICVIDLLGKEILQQPFSGEEATLNIDRKGIYIVEVKSEDVNWRKKVFVY